MTFEEKNIYLLLQAHFSWYYHSKARLIKKWIMYCYPQCNPSMYHYNLNNVNITAVPIIHLINSHLIHSNGSSPHLHLTTIFYPPFHSRLHQSTLQKCTINSRLPQPNFLNNFCFLDLSTLHGQWTCCWMRKNPITLKKFTWYAVVFTHLSPWPLLVWYKCILGIFLQKKIGV